MTSARATPPRLAPRARPPRPPATRAPASPAASSHSPPPKLSFQRRRKGAWEVVHDKLYIVSGEGELITIDAAAVNENIDPKVFFDDVMKTYREEEGLKYPECWHYTSFEEDEEDGDFANENLFLNFAPLPPPTP